MTTSKLKPRYMMATTAIHLTGDISREQPDLCLISAEDTDNYIGQWVTGFGFIEVRFPKTTTRALTSEEIDRYHGRLMSLGGGVYALNLTGENFNLPVIVTKVTAGGEGPSRRGTLIAPIRVGSSLALREDSGSQFTTSEIRAVKAGKVVTKNSVYRVRYLHPAKLRKKT